MIMFAPCVVCLMTDQKKATHKKPSIVFHHGRLTDEGYILVKCPKGHESVVVYDERRHDTLFQSACYAYLSGYEREAVSGFAAAIERAYEFFIRVVARKVGMSSSVFDPTWKIMTKQSERQFGCFVMLYAMETQTPYLIDNKQVAFRNSVIHQGYLPKAQETWDFANSVFTTKVHLVKLLQERCAHAVEEIVREDLEEAKVKAPSNLPQLAMKQFPVFVPHGSNEGHDIDNFPSYLQALRTRWDQPQSNS